MGRRVQDPYILTPRAILSSCSVTTVLGSVHTTLEEFKNGSFTLKTHQMFFVHTTPEEFKNATITDQFRFVFEENSGREIT